MGKKSKKIKDEYEDHAKLEHVKEELTIFWSFPREVGTNRIWINDAEEFKDYIETYNGSKRIFSTIYRQTIRDESKIFGSAIAEGAVVDKIFLDFDNSWGYECFCIVRDWLLKNDIIFRVNLSGKNTSHDPRTKKKYKEPRSLGFHFYIFIVPNLQYSKTALRNVHIALNKMISKKLEKEFKVKTVPVKMRWVKKKIQGVMRKIQETVPEEEIPLKEIYSPIDPKVMGDVRRIATVTNTYNVKRKRYCISLKESELFLSAKEMCKLTEKQRKITDDVWIGNYLWDVPKKYDKSTLDEITDVYEFDGVKPNMHVLSNFNVAKCIRKLMSIPTLGYELRFLVIIYFRDCAFTPNETKAILKSFLTPDKYQHCVHEERMVFRCYYGNQKGAYLIDCGKMRKKIRCSKECVDCSRYSIGHPVYE